MARDPTRKALSPRRVIVGLEGLPRSRAALQAAADIAARSEAELLALFVEDANLLEWAALPFAREVGFPSALTRAPDPLALERTLRALARDAERMLAALARGTPLRWSYRVARGALMRELLAAAAETDLVVAGSVAGWTPRRLAASTPAAVMLVEEMLRPGVPAVAACSSALSPALAARRLQELAALLGQNRALTLVLLCEAPEAAERWTRALRKLASPLELQVVVARDEAELQATLAALRRPVVVLREPPAPQARGSSSSGTRAGRTPRAP